MPLTVGSLFSGYGGLDIAVTSTIHSTLTWYSEIDPAANQIMETHNPGVPNLGDVTELQWGSVPPVDILTGGYPCQPFSMAGKRRGKDDERHLWPYVRDAISALGPRLVILENVRGHLTMGFADVLADLTDLGMSARWGVIRASDAGAPHQRARLFIVAYPDSVRHGCRQGPAGMGGMVSPTEGNPREWEWAWQKPGTRGPKNASNPTGTEWGNTEPEHLETGERPTEPRERSRISWGDYGPAIRRWEQILGRAAPAPAIPRGDKNRLNPVFVEWMMGLPEGHVTGHGLNARSELQMLGNGVVPQQARLALNYLL